MIPPIDVADWERVDRILQNRLSAREYEAVYTIIERGQRAQGDRAALLAVVRAAGVLRLAFVALQEATDPARFTVAIGMVQSADDGLIEALAALPAAVRTEMEREP